VSILAAYKIVIRQEYKLLQVSNYLMRLKDTKITTSILGVVTVLIIISFTSVEPSHYIVKASSLSIGKSTVGSMSGLRPVNYNVSGYSGIVGVTSKQNATSTLVYSHSNMLSAGNSTSQNKDLIYSVKFECGSVSGNDGPLRPGHYNTDISIFNSQGYTIPILWNAVINNGKSTTSILKTLQPQTSASIICKDILQLFNVYNNTGNLVEGFILIRPQVDSGGMASFLGNSATVSSPSQDHGNLLDVQVFYSANSLLTPSHDITMDKVLFIIVNDTSGKLPLSMVQKPLDVTVASQVNQIIDPESQVRDALAAQYSLTSLEKAHIKIHIISVSLGTSTTVDDHAISSFQVRPQSSS
jgi:hypothetical protein